MTADFSWLDELHVKVAYGPYPGEAPEVVYLLTVGGPDFGGHTWDDDACVAELHHLVETGSGDMRYEVPYDLAVRKTHFSWGADAASAEILLYIADHLAGGALDGVVGWAAVEALGRVRELVRPSSEGTFSDRIENLVSYGEWSVRAAFSEWLTDETALTLIEEDRAAGEWTGWFRDPEGYEFGVTLRPVEGHPYRVRVARRAPTQGHSLPPLLSPDRDVPER